MQGLSNPSIQKLALDVTSDEDVERVIQTILHAEGKVDIVVNNAGTLGIRPLIDLSLNQAKQTFDTNVFAALRTAKAVVPSMAKRRSGLIINIGSIVADVPTPWNGIYCASKAALHSISEVLQMECRPFNIDVMLVAPGAVKSNIAKNQEAIFELPPNSLYADYLENILNRLHASQASNRMPTDAFAELVVTKALQTKPPTYLTAGGNSMLFALLRWLPRAWVLFLMWRKFGRR
jgi:short-subunit dehydrogenase